MALLGVATIPGFYLFARNLYGPRAAIIGTILLVFSYWHIHYSRTAFSLVSTPLVECLVLLFLGKGVKDGRAWPFLVAGILAVGGIYTYRGYAFFAFLLIALWVVVILYRPYALKRLALHAILFALPAILVAIPMLKFIGDSYDEYIIYGRIVSVFNSPEYQEADRWGAAGFMTHNVGRAISVYYLPRRADSTDGLGSQGLLDYVTMALFTLGLGVAIWRWRRWQFFLILAGIAIGIAAVAITVPWGENRRGIAALPMVFAAAGVGGDALLDRARWLFQRLNPQRTALLFVVVWNIQLYFRTIAPADTTRFTYAFELSRASAYLRSQEPKPYVYFYSPRWSWDYEAWRFQAPGLLGEDRSWEFGEFTLERQADHQRVVYLMMPPYDSYLDEVRHSYPGGSYTEEREGDRLIYLAYQLEGP